jgi:hypothetical protein
MVDPDTKRSAGCGGWLVLVVTFAAVASALAVELFR